MRVFVNRDVCALQGECANHEPRVFRIEDGELEYTADVDTAADQTLAEGIEDAVFLCPTQAIEAAP